MRLPALLVLTDRTQALRPLPDTVAAAIDGGARAVVLREKDLPAPERRRLASTIADLLAPVDGTLLLAGPQPPSDRVDGVHLAARDPRPVPRPSLVGRSCHDHAEVRRAGAEGCDYVTVSPLRPTRSKPGYGPPLGLRGVARLVAEPAAPPVYALGGVGAADARGCLTAGAAGVAVMGPVMRAERPDRCVHHLLAALEAARTDAARTDTACNDTAEAAQ